MAKKEKHNYVDKVKLYEELVKYNEKLKAAKDAGTKLPIIPDYVGICIEKISSKLSLNPNFINYSFREEMISDGIIDCIAAVDNFDVVRYDNPFAYFTTIAWWAFVRRITKEKKEAYIKAKNLEHSFMFSDFIENDEITNNDLINNDKHNELIRSFEETLQNKKIKQLETKRLKEIEKVKNNE